MPVVWDVILAFARGFDRYVRSCSWHEERKCKGIPTEVFFPEPSYEVMAPDGEIYLVQKPQSEFVKELRHAQAFCDQCEVQNFCESFALMSHEFGSGNITSSSFYPGVWAGHGGQRPTIQLMSNWKKRFVRAGLKPPVIEHPSIRDIMTALDKKSVNPNALTSRGSTSWKVNMDELNEQIARKVQRLLPQIITVIGDGFEARSGQVHAYLAEELGESSIATGQVVEWLGYKKLIEILPSDRSGYEVMTMTQKAHDVVAGRETLVEAPAQVKEAVESEEDRKARLEQLRDERHARHGVQRLLDGRPPRKTLSNVRFTPQERLILDGLVDGPVCASNGQTAIEVLARKIELKRDETGRITSQLKARGFVTITRNDSNDKTVVRVELSAEGQEAIGAVITAIETSPSLPEGESSDQVAYEATTERPEATAPETKVEVPDIPAEFLSKHIITRQTLDLMTVLYRMPDHRLVVDGAMKNMRPLMDATSSENPRSLNGFVRRLVEKGLVHIELINPRRTKYVELTPLGIATLLYHRPELATGAEAVRTDDPAECGEDDEVVSTHETEPQEDSVVALLEAELELREDDVQSAASLGNLLDEEQRGSILLLVEELRARRDRLSGQISDLRIELFATEQQLDVLNLLLANQE